MMDPDTGEFRYIEDLVVASMGPLYITTFR